MIDEPLRNYNEKRRSSLDIIARILNVIGKGGKKKTHIMYEANLNWRQLNAYLSLLVARGFITQDDENVYRITEKGERFLSSYKALKNILK